MQIEVNDGMGSGDPAQGIVRWDGQAGMRDVASVIVARELRLLNFVDSEFFSESGKGITLCRRMRELGVNALWSASLTSLPSSGLLEEMRLSGCQRLEMALAPDAAETALSRAREFGFDITVRNADGAPYAIASSPYTVAEREAVVERLPGLHAAQFDLAVAYYKARRFDDVMFPLGKAMTLRFPFNELCLNLLACLSAAKHYPDMASGLLRQAEYGSPHPVVFRNRERLKSWLENGGDVRGIRLMLEPAV